MDQHRQSQQKITAMQFNAFETYAWNVLVLDTVEEDVKALAKTYMERIHSNGALGVCVLGEAAGKSLATRKRMQNPIMHHILFTAVADIIILPEIGWKDTLRQQFRQV